jgi:[acyl-carrier-protein] S-malonyltransferase
VEALPVKDPANIKELLVKQLYSPVLWRQSIEWLKAAGIEEYKEVGPGKVLTGLIRRILR